MAFSDAILGRLVNRLKLETYKPFTRPNPIYRVLAAREEALSRSSAIVILGMHRSGTSLFAKYMHECGLDIGENHIDVSFDNPRGFWEDSFFVHASSDLLVHTGSSPDGLDRTENLVRSRDRSTELVSASNLARLRHYLAKSFTHSVWGWKDPRTCITFPYFEKAFAELGIRDVRLLIVFRSPVEVAKSLIRRGTNDYLKGSEEVRYSRALECWTVYNRFCIEYSEKYPSLFIDYRDLLKPEKAYGVLKGCAEFAGLDTTSFAFPEGVFERSLVHHKSNDEALPEGTQKVLDELIARAGKCRQDFLSTVPEK